MIVDSQLPRDPTVRRPALDLSARRLSYVISVYIGPVAVLLLLWDLASRLVGIPRLFPPPITTLQTLLKLLQDGSLPSNSIASLMRILVGFFIGSFIGAIAGLLMGASKPLRHILDPYIDFFRFVSAVAWVSTFMIWFGIGEASKIMLLVYATVFGVSINVTAGVLAIPRSKLRVAQCFGASPRQIFFWVVLPATVPYIVSGMRIAMQNSFMVIVVAEMIAAREGLGFLIMSARTFLAPDRILVAILALGVLGFLTDSALMLLARVTLGRFQRPS